MTHYYGLFGVLYVFGCLDGLRSLILLRKLPLRLLYGIGLIYSLRSCYFNILGFVCFGVFITIINQIKKINVPNYQRVIKNFHQNT